jgi:hypothetical protein
MNYGRINERNIGNHKLDGGAKRAKAIIEPILTDEQYRAKEAVRLCNMILNGGIKIYETIPELVQHWLRNSIVELKEFENSCAPARSYKPFETRAILIEKHRSSVEFVKGLLISFHKL